MDGSSFNFSIEHAADSTLLVFHLQKCLNLLTFAIITCTFFSCIELDQILSFFSLNKQHAAIVICFIEMDEEANRKEANSVHPDSNV